MANKEEKQINPWDLLRADVKMYQADCMMMSIGADEQCRRCIKNVFDSILGMIDRYAKQAGSGAPERKTGGWNVITKCPMDADEIATWSENLGYEIPDDEAFMYGNLPEEGVEVLVCTLSGTIFIDTLCRDVGCYFEEYGEMDGIVAWMPLPEPYYGLGQAFDPD